MNPHLSAQEHADVDDAVFYAHKSEGRRITSEQAGEVARIMDAAFIQDARRVHRTRAADAAIPPEVGNVWFMPNEPEPLTEPDDPDAWRPLGRKEILIVSGIATCILVPWVVLIAVAVGYLVERVLV